VPFQVLRHPEIPTAAGDLAGSAIEFFGFKLRAQGARLDGFAGLSARKPVDLLRRVPLASMN